MVSVVLSVGSNCGDRELALKKSLEWLKTILIQVSFSPIYETPCVNKAGNPYLNMVVKGFFQGTGFELESLLKGKEKELGRTAGCKERGEVPVDIDIVILDGDIVKPWDYRQKFFTIGYQQLS